MDQKTIEELKKLCNNLTNQSQSISKSLFEQNKAQKLMDKLFPENEQKTTVENTKN